MTDASYSSVGKDMNWA